jgi:hypothetical protein
MNQNSRGRKIQGIEFKRDAVSLPIFDPLPASAGNIEMLKWSGIV